MLSAEGGSAPPRRVKHDHARFGLAALRSGLRGQIGKGQEHLVRVENDLLFHSEAVEKARGLLISFIKKEGKLESVKFKYLLNTSRKFAIPLLDYFDRIGLTRRAGYTRYLKNPNVE